MENLILLLATAFLFRKETPAPKVMTVSSCGCTATLPATPLTRRLQDESGNPVYVGHVKEEGITYGFATVELSQTLYNRAEAEQALFLFMEDMHASFDIAVTAGLQYGYTHPYSDAVWGMTDYWQDEECVDWKVKGWTDGRIMTALYVKGIGQSCIDQQEAFLDSFRFNPVQKLVQ